MIASYLACNLPTPPIGKHRLGTAKLDPFAASFELSDLRGVGACRIRSVSMTQERSVALRGFAGMDAEKRHKIAKKGGASVPREKRSFAQNPELAAQAGRKGGLAAASQPHRARFPWLSCSLSQPPGRGYPLP